MAYRFRIFLCALLLGMPLASCAARQDLDSAVKGETPETGRVVVRSGLAWLDESAPVYQPLWAELRRVCADRGWTVVDVPPSRMEPLPENPLPASSGGAGSLPDESIYTPAQTGARQYRADGRPEAGEDLRTQARAAELAKAGKLPATRLQSYASPAKDAELPPSVMAVAPPDFATYLYSLSQLRGKPTLRGGSSVPFRVPSELSASDPARADYAFLARFAVIAPPVRGGGGAALPGGRGGTAGSGALIRGVRSLGFGASGGAGLYGGSGRGSGSVGGYMRGYDGNAPGSDIWHRDADYRRRDYARQIGPQPVQSAPPHALSGDVNRDVPASREGAVGGVPSGSTGSADLIVSGGEYLVLELEMYDLAPARDGGEALLIWSGRAVGAATGNIAASLPELAASLF